MWDASTGEELRVLKGHTAPVTSCAVSGNGRLIISTSQDGTLRVWDATTGRGVLTSSFDAALYDCAFHPDGEHLVVCGDRGMYFLRMAK